MGTFVDTYRDKDARFKEDKRSEFEQRLQELVWAGGMMCAEKVNLFGASILVMRKPSIDSDGMVYWYNYFEDRNWEDAGYDKKEGCVYSNKIGGSEFNMTQTAAHVLESLYYDGIAAVIVNGDPIQEKDYTGWINWLFDEKFVEKNENPWPLYESMHYDENYHDYARGIRVGDNADGFVGQFEIDCVENGIDDTCGKLKKLLGDQLGRVNDNFNAIGALLNIPSSIRAFKEKSKLPQNDQMHFLMDVLRKAYAAEDSKMSIRKVTTDDNVTAMLLYIMLSNAPVVAVKTIAEEYDADFWELWGQIRDLIHPWALASEKFEEMRKIPTCDTATFFDLGYQDLLLYWKQDGKIPIEENTQKWLDQIKEKFEEKLKGEPKHYKIRDLVYLLMDTNFYYGRVMPMDWLFYESLENIVDEHMRAYWSVFEDMVYDKKRQQQSVHLLVSDSEAEIDTPEQRASVKRYLTDKWNYKEERQNPGRMELKRYLALGSNKELRMKVLGF